MRVSDAADAHDLAGQVDDAVGREQVLAVARQALGVAVDQGPHALVEVARVAGGQELHARCTSGGSERICRRPSTTAASCEAARRLFLRWALALTLRVSATPSAVRSRRTDRALTSSTRLYQTSRWPIAAKSRIAGR